MIQQALCNTFKVELFQGVHVFGVGGDTFMLALYTSAADLGKDTPVYSSANEHPNSVEYTAGGKQVIAIDPKLSEDIAYIDFLDVTWIDPAIRARGALIYNASRANRAVAVFDFGSDKLSNPEGLFTVAFPPFDTVNAIIRIV